MVLVQRFQDALCEIGFTSSFVEARQRQPQSHAVHGVARKVYLLFQRFLADALKAVLLAQALHLLQRFERSRGIRQRKQEGLQLLHPVLRFKNLDAQRNGGLSRAAPGSQTGRDFFDERLVLGPARQLEKPAAGGRAPGGGPRPAHVFLHGFPHLALVFVHRARLVGVERGIGKLLPSRGHDTKGVVEAEIIPVHGGCLEVPLGFSRLQSGKPLPLRTRTSKHFTVGINLADASHSSAVSRVAELEVLFDGNSRRYVFGIVGGQRAMDGGGPLTELPVAGVFRGQRLEHRRRRLKMRAPRFGLGHEPCGRRV